MDGADDPALLAAVLCSGQGDVAEMAALRARLDDECQVSGWVLVLDLYVHRLCRYCKDATSQLYRASRL